MTGTIPALVLSMSPLDHAHHELGLIPDFSRSRTVVLLLLKVVTKSQICGRFAIREYNYQYLIHQWTSRYLHTSMPVKGLHLPIQLSQTFTILTCPHRSRQYHSEPKNQSQSQTLPLQLSKSSQGTLTHPPPSHPSPGFLVRQSKIPFMHMWQRQVDASPRSTHI